MKRLAPRPLKAALEAAVGRSAPIGMLAQAQRLWPDVAGAAVAAESQPDSERDGVLIVRCTSAMWAHELELLGPEIRARLNAALGADGGIRELRFIAASPPA